MKIPHLEESSRIVEKFKGYSVIGNENTETVDVYLCAECERHVQAFYRLAGCAIGGFIAILIVFAILSHC
jgi:hypothetical protein